MIDPDTPISSDETWVLAGDVAAQFVADLANEEKDKSDEAVDAKRINDGKTLDEFLQKK